MNSLTGRPCRDNVGLGRSQVTEMYSTIEFSFAEFALLLMSANLNYKTALKEINFNGTYIRVDILYQKASTITTTTVPIIFV